MDAFDERVHFLKEVRIRDVSSFESLAQIEEQLLLWGETERVSQLFERRPLIMYKLYGMEVKKSVDEHLENFKPTEPSVNYDYMCIRFLTPKASKAGDAVIADTLQITLTPSTQPRVPALEFSTQDEQEQAAARKADQTDEQIKTVDQVVEQEKDKANEQLGFLDGKQEQPVPEKEDDPQHSPVHSSSRSSSFHPSMHSV
ncbi:hypothetical protein F511_35668 [Dorcoceras hygrometricum]|uniref:Uncharacterized protein n=1 Tax=Dorcoceras hygrometricum TaxID=472368 RepID=A0A2Z7C7H1_9LAMI|nr:hypothetical protein F511_35668 [Dorcoceras hygrometricum]